LVLQKIRYLPFAVLNGLCALVGQAGERPGWKLVYEPPQHLGVLWIDFGRIRLLGFAELLVLFVLGEMVFLGITQLTDIDAPLLDQSRTAVLPASAFLNSPTNPRRGNRRRCAEGHAAQREAAGDERACDVGCHGQFGMAVSSPISPIHTPHSKRPREPSRSGAGFCAQNVLTACSIEWIFAGKNAFTSINAELRGEPPVRIELTTARLQGD
jgi:hypothetical protein